MAHELTHAVQWDCKRIFDGKNVLIDYACSLKLNGGLVEGIADYVRLKMGFSPSHWKRNGSGSYFDGYETTGYFLNWIEKSGLNEHFVKRLNYLVAANGYTDSLFIELTGCDVETLWANYLSVIKVKE